MYSTSQKGSAILWIVFILVIGGIIFAMIQFSKNNAPGTDEYIVKTLEEPVTEDDWTKGNTDPSAQLTLVEYSDFQCPACRFQTPLVDQILEEYGDQIRFVYRHFPLSNHPYARLAGRAAEAAGNQGQFFAMHDLLFEGQPQWAIKTTKQVREEFISYAADLGLNMEQFEDDLDSQETRDAVNDDSASGRASQVTGTPTFFLNGLSFPNPGSIESFRNIIELGLNTMELENTTEEALQSEGETVPDMDNSGDNHNAQ